MRLVRIIALGALLSLPRAAAGQQWSPGGAIDLVRRAAMHRSSRDADSVLANWHARAHGMVRFTSLSGEAPNQVERVLRADELRVDVYGAWPERNKQVIVAWRDTSFLPNTLRYHRDHLGIVANDFGGTIRIGDGDEVRDLIHPLSDSGLVHYQFAVGDTTTIASARSKVRVVAVAVRPTNPESAGVVGTLYLDLDRAALVRFLFTFTPAAYRDASVENITVTLENSLQEGARWLPWRQSIAIQRGSPLFDLPWRTIIRGDWEIDEYTLGTTEPPSRFAGVPIDGLRRPMPGATWEGRLVDRLGTLPASDADIDRAQREATQALSGRSLEGLPGVRLFGGGVGDFLHVNRVQGITPQFGLRVGLGARWITRMQLGLGLSDHRVVGHVELVRPLGSARLTLFTGRAVRDLVDTPVISSSANSIGTILSGDDHGDYVLVERAGARLSTTLRTVNVSLEAAREWSWSVATAFTPISGTARPNPALGAGGATVGRLSLWHRRADEDGWSSTVEGGVGNSAWARVALGAQGTVRFGRDALVLRGEIGLGSAELPNYRAFVMGGRGSLLGVPDRSLGGRRTAQAEVAWAMPVAIPMPRVTNRFRIRLPSTLSLVAAAGIAGGPMTGLPWEASGRIEPVAGLRLDLWGPLLRLEGGVSLRTGHVGVAFDLHPAWWPFF